jgi:hypothetical protein
MWHGVRRCTVLAFVTIGCAAVQPQPSRIVGLESDPPSDCQALGEVVGKDVDEEGPDMDEAMARAWKKAEALGATHVREVPRKTGNWYARAVVYTGLAYRCPPGVAPAPKG